MKKLFAMILALCVALSLCACGGTNGGDTDNGGSADTTTKPNTTTAPKEDSVTGFYELVALQDEEGYYEMKSEEMSHLNPDELSYVILNEGNTATLMLEFEEYQMTYNGSSFLDEEGGAIDYEFKDGQLVIYFEDDLTFYYEKSDREGPSEGEQKGGEAFPQSAIESFEGDWHGWCIINYGMGAFENDADVTFEIIARFAFDENGNCRPYFAIPVEDQADNFHNVTATYDSYGDYLYFYGELFGTDINEGNLADLGGLLMGNLVLDEGDDYASISFNMRRIGDSWDPEIDDPCMPDDVQAYYADMDLIDIAELYGVDLDLIPEN